MKKYWIVKIIFIIAQTIALFYIIKGAKEWALIVWLIVLVVFAYAEGYWKGINKLTVRDKG